MPEFDLDQLFALARDRTPAARQQLIDAVAWRFGDAHELAARERELLGDILDRLLSACAAEVRQGLADRLAAQPSAPRELVAWLATDDAEIAHPVLVRSAALAVDDLLHVVDAKGPPHQAAVAQRRNLPREVSAQLAARGTIEVCIALLRNRTAELDRPTRETLTDRAKAVPRLQRPLLERPELGSDLAARLYWFVGQRLRSYIRQRYAVPEKLLSGAIADTVETLLADTGPDPETLAERAAIDGELLCAVLRRGQRDLFGRLFAIVLDLPETLVAALLPDRQRRLLAVAAKAVRLDRESFATLYLLSRDTAPGAAVADESQLADALAAFDAVDGDAAAQRLASWQAQPQRLQRELGADG